MEILGAFLSEQMIERIGWMLVHFLWQGIAVAALMWCVLKVLRRSSANVRYITPCAGLVLMIAAPVVTFMITGADTNVAAVPMAPSAEPVEPITTTVQTPTIIKSSIEPIELPKPSFFESLTAKLETVLPYCVVGWFVGVAVLSVWYLGGWCQLQKLRRIGTKAVSDCIEANASLLAQRLGIRRAVQIVESALVQVPTVIGWLKPVILLPASALTGLDEIQLTAMIAHELGHIKRCDYLVNIIQTVVEILGFYHPAVWWMSRQIRIERENCCDDMAVALVQNRKEYAGALFTMEAIRSKQLDLAVAANGGHLQDRISRLAGQPAKGQKSGWVLSIIAMIAIMTACALSVGNRPTESEAGSQKPEEIATENTENQEFKKTLPNGVTVELLGVCEHPSEGKQWWSPDGDVLDQRSYSRMETLHTHPDQGRKALEAAIQVDGCDDGIGYRFGVTGSVASGACGTDEQNLYAISFDQPENADVTDIEIGIAAGPWRTEATQDSNFFGVISSRDIIWHGPIEKGKGTVLHIAHSLLDKNARVVALGKNGKEYTGGSASAEKEGLKIVQINFDVPLSKIKKFQLQTRDYEWITFKNVSLRPGGEKEGVVDEGRLTNDEAAEDNVIENTIIATQLSDFERGLIGQVLTLVPEIEKEYSQQATHWPVGPSLYHVDRNGDVTFWSYQKLWRRSKDCGENEVGWGSSELSCAQGMYYLPDGTPLKSRWSERNKRGKPGRGMKDIRVDVGRSVSEDERIGVIHRHRLSPDQELLSDDGLEKSIRLRYWKDLPLAILVRIDKPMQLSSWNLGGLESDIEHFDEYDQLIVKGLPQVDTAALLVTTTFPEERKGLEVKASVPNPPAMGGGMMGGASYVKAEQELSTSQILTTGYLIRVPADMPELKGIVPEKGAKEGIMISPEKLGVFLEAVRTNLQAKILANPRVLSNDNEEAKVAIVEEVPYTQEDGEIAYRDIGLKVSITHHITPDNKSIRTEVEYERSLDVGNGDVTMHTVASMVTLLSGHAFALGGYEIAEGVELFLVQPKILERRPSASSPQSSEEMVESLPAMGGGMGGFGGAKPGDEIVYPKNWDEIVAEKNNNRGINTVEYPSTNKSVLADPNQMAPELYHIADLLSLPANFKSTDNVLEQIQSRVEELKQTVIQTIEPESWLENGGRGRIDIHTESKLMVYQTLAIHQKIKEYLEEKREKLSKQVAIESRFILVDDNFLDDIGLGVSDLEGQYAVSSDIDDLVVGPADSKEILAALEHKPLEQREFPELKTLTEKVQKLDDLQTEFILKTTQAHKNVKILTTPKAMVLNGETACIQVSTDKRYKASADGQSKDVTTGITLDILPTIQKDDKAVLLKGHFQLSEVLEWQEHDKGDEAYLIPIMQVANIPIHTIIENSKTVLIEGPELEISKEAKENSTIPIIGRFFSNRSKVTDKQRLLVLVKPIVIEQQEVEPPARFGGGMMGGFGGGVFYDGIYQPPDKQE